MSAEDRLLTPEQVAERLQLSPVTILHWLRAGRLPGVKLGKLWRVREAELQHYIEQLDHGAEEEAP
jgi:excisionase family DNA binding protein